MNISAKDGGFMQPKVSMVIPCYNKANFIGNTFDSVLAQKWDNIELILVNDGSTDGTRGIISEYEPKFRKRGYEVAILDQENKGVSGAVYAGLKLATGEFVCQFDADDELSPEYVSVMAGWLAEHKSCQWTVCDMSRTDENHFGTIPYFPDGVEIGCRIEAFILLKTAFSVCVFMIRRSYLVSCGVMEFFYAGRKGAQEAQISFPLLAGGGKVKYFQIPLYNITYFQPETHHSYRALSARFDEVVEYYEEWLVTVKETIKKLSVANGEKKRFLLLCEMSLIEQIIEHYTADEPQNKERLEEMFRQYIVMVENYFSISLKEKQIPFENAVYFMQAVADNILGAKIKNAGKKTNSGRVIAWGVLGKRGRRLLPALKGTEFEPDELWDVAGDGVAVKTPDCGSLTPEDMVLIMPIKSIADDIAGQIKKSGCLTVFSQELVRYVSFDEFPQFYDGSLRYNPDANDR